MNRIAASLKKLTALFFVPVALAFMLAGNGCAQQGSSSSAPAKHEFVTIDEGLGALIYINERDESKNWKIITGLEQARDLQLVGNGRLLVGHNRGYSEYDLRTGRELKKFDGLKGVTSARRQPDGTTLIAGVNLDGEKAVCVFTLDAADKIIKRVTYPGDYVRLIRQTAQGTYLMCCNTEIREASTDGKYLKTIPVDGFKHMWKAVRLPNQHIIASAGYGAFMVELDENGTVLRKWGAKGQVPDEVNPHFAASFQLLRNGNVMQVNWQGHGPDHGKSGVQALEYDRDGKIVWQWSRADMISSLQGLLVLDGLDTSKLHDERSGVMAPIK